MPTVHTPRNAPKAPPEPQVSAPPMNVLIQARLPNGEGPKFQLERITGVLDAIDKVKPLVQVELEGPDGQPRQHQLPYHADPDGGFKDWVEAQTSIPHTIENLLPSPTSEPEGAASGLDAVSYLKQDLWRKAACDRFLEYYRASKEKEAALNEWINRSHSNINAAFPELVTGFPKFEFSLGTVERQSLLPAPASCDPTAIAGLQAALTKSSQNNGARHKTTLKYAEKLRLWPAADSCASQTLLEVVQSYLASAAGNLDADGLLTEVETARNAINARFEQNLKQALDARDRVLRPIYQLHSLFHRLDRNALLGEKASIRVWLVNAHWFDRKDLNESVIGSGDYQLGRSAADDPINGSELFWGQPGHCGLTLKPFEAISDTSMAPTMLVITDRLEGGREEAYLAFVARTRRVLVLANVDSDVFAGQADGTEANVKEAVKALSDTYGLSGEEGVDGVGLFAVDMAVRGGENNNASPLTVPPAAEAAGLLLATGFQAIPSGQDFCVPCIGIPEGAINMEDLPHSFPVNVLRQTEGPKFHYRGFQGLDAHRSSLIHRVLCDRVSLVGRRFMLRQSPPADKSALDGIRRGLNEELRLSFNMGRNSLLVSAAIPRDEGAMDFRTNAAGKIEVEAPIDVKLKNVPTSIRVPLNVELVNSHPVSQE